MENSFERLEKYRDSHKVTPEAVSEICQEVIRLLGKNFGVRDFSDSEFFDIRRNVEDILKRNNELVSDFNKTNAKEKSQIINLNIMRYPYADNKKNR